MIQIETSGNPKIIGAAPTEALKKQLEPLLSRTSASNFNLEIIRRLRPRDSAGVVIQRIDGSGVQVNVQGDTAEKLNYRCIVSSNTLRDEELMKELVAAAKDLQGVEVAEQQTAPPVKRTYKKRKTDQSSKKGVIPALMGDGLVDLLKSIAASVQGAGSASSSKIIDGIMKDLAPKCKRQGLGGIFYWLKRRKFLRLVDGTKMPKVYGLTQKALDMIGNPQGCAFLIPNTLSPLLAQLAELEASETRLGALRAEIGADEQALAAKRLEAEKLQASIGKLAEVRKLLAPAETAEQTTQT